jgi:hypothetical protein
MASLVLEKESIHSSWREIAATVISPATSFNRLAFGERFRPVFPSHDPAHFTRLQVASAAAPGGQREPLERAPAAQRGAADFYLEYGLPGKRGYEYERPFDYFAFQATLSSANGFENAMTRGLLKAKPMRKATTSAVSWDSTGPTITSIRRPFACRAPRYRLAHQLQWQPSKDYILQSTGLAGLGYNRGRHGARNGRWRLPLRPAPQALVATRLIYRDRAAIDVTLREYFVTRVGAASGGHENIARTDVAFTWRVLGQHGISIKYLGKLPRHLQPRHRDVSTRRSTVGIFYTRLGNERFGAVDWR